MRSIPLSRLAAVAAVVLASSSPLDAAVISSRTLDRLKEAVVVTGAATPDFVGYTVNNADVTLAPNEIFAWAYDGATTSWRQVVFQIDEVNNTYPNSPPPDMGNGCGRQRGRNYYGTTVTSLPGADRAVRVADLVVEDAAARVFDGVQRLGHHLLGQLALVERFIARLDAELRMFQQQAGVGQQRR